MKKGTFVVFEGLDGSGQTTQITLLEKYLKSQNKKVHITHEPTDNIIGGLIRGLLTKSWALNNTGMQLLYCADRSHHLEAEIIPALDAGQIVISGRYLFSTIAFGSLNNDIAWLETLNEKFLHADITFFIRVAPRECIKRINGSRFRKELFEKEKILEKVIKTYDKIFASKKYKNIHIINGEQSVEKVSQDIIRIIDKELRRF